MRSEIQQKQDAFLPKSEMWIVNGGVSVLNHKNLHIKKFQSNIKRMLGTFEDLIIWMWAFTAEELRDLHFKQFLKTELMTALL